MNYKSKDGKHYFFFAILLIISFHHPVFGVTLDWNVPSIHWFSPNEFNDFVGDGPYVEKGYIIEETNPSTGYVDPFVFAMGDWGSSDPDGSYRVSRVGGNLLSLVSFEYFFDDSVKIESSKGGIVIVPGGFGIQSFSGIDWTDISYFDITPVNQSLPFSAEGVFDAMTFITEPSDLNSDGWVDGLDLGILLGNWGQNTTLDQGELNGTPPVDGLDLGILLGSWNPPPALATSIPEPSTLLLTFSALCFGLIRTRR